MLDPILVDTPTQFPGQCIDGSQGTLHEPVVDTHVEVPGYGRIYLSKRVIRDAGRLYGFRTADEYHQSEQARAAAEAKVVELETALADAEPILAAMAKASARYGTED